METVNKVQKSYNKLLKLEGVFNNLIDLGHTDQALQIMQSIDAARVGVWLSVWLETKDTNPSMINDIRAGHYRGEAFTSSEICYLQKNFHIITIGRCGHCGKTH